MAWDDTASADRLVIQMQKIMRTLIDWENKMGKSNDVLDSMMDTYYKHHQAIERMNKGQSQFYERLKSSQVAFNDQQNKIHKNMMSKAKIRADEQARQTQEVNARNAAYFSMQKEMVDYRHSFKDFDSGLQLLSNAMKGAGLGFASGGAVAGLKGGKGILDSVAKEKSKAREAAEAQDALRDFGLKHGRKNLNLTRHKKLKEKEDLLTSARDKTAEAHKDSKSGFLYQMGQGQLGGKTLSERLKGLSDWFSRNKKGVFLALGTMVALGAIIKTALDSSPMFQQMLKLWKFAITMIFRPLGDFFGFFFRPILVMLLRKFIIPWYTTMYPAMIKLGNDLGSFVTGALEWFLGVGAKILAFFGGLGTGTFDINSLVSMLIGGTKIIGSGFIDILIGKLIPSAFATTGQTILTDAWDLFFNAISGILNTMRPYVVTAIQFVGDVSRWLVSEGAKAIKWGFETIKDQMPFIISVFTWLKEQMPNVKILFETFMTSLEWMKTKWTQISTVLTTAYTMLMSAVNILMMLPSNIYTGLLSLPQQIGDGIMSIFTGIFNYLNGFFGNSFDPSSFNISGFAEGGRITEPILGVGRSGRKYSFGERGSETVIPDGKGGFGGITINIQNMSGSQQDLNNLRQTILSVIQESRSRGGRI